MSVRTPVVLLTALLSAAFAATVPASAAPNRLVYVSLITGLTSGVTNVYNATPNGQLVASLNRGGGGPIAVDAQRRVYVVDADYDSNFVEINSRIFVYPPGATKPSRLLVANNFGAQAMAVARDGTVYVAGSKYPSSGGSEVLAFGPGSKTPRALPVDPRQPYFSTGMAVDAAGDVFVGWFSGSGRCHLAETANFNGCVEELPAGQDKWKVRLSGVTANSLMGGPLLLSDGALVVHTAAANFNYLITYPSGRRIPLRVVPLSVLPSNQESPMAFNAARNEIWGIQSGFSSNNTLYGIDYPSGAVVASIPVNDGSSEFIVTGLAVSPAASP